MRVTPEQARARLAQAEAVRIDDSGDRRVHGTATAGFGLVIGAYVAVQQVVADAAPWNGVLVAGYVLLLGALARWQARASQVVPRRTRLVARSGVAGTLAMMAGALLLLNLSDGGGDVGGGRAVVLVLVAVVVALPMVAAGLLIRRGAVR